MNVSLCGKLRKGSWYLMHRQAEALAIWVAPLEIVTCTYGYEAAIHRISLQITC